MIFHYTRAPKSQDWQISSICCIFFSTKLHIFHSFFNFSPPGWLPGALGPFSKERSHFSASDGTPKTSVRWNLTRFRTVQSSKFHVFAFHTYVYKYVYKYVYTYVYTYRLRVRDFVLGRRRERKVAAVSVRARMHGMLGVRMRAVEIKTKRTTAHTRTHIRPWIKLL